MEITRQVIDGWTTMVLAGRFDAHEVPEFEAEFESLTAVLTDPTSSPKGNIVHFDLGDVEFIDSSGLAQLVRCHKMLQSAAHEMHLSRVSNAVKVILEMTRLDAVFGPIDPESS